MTTELDALPESVRKALDMLPSMACTSDEEDAVGVLRSALLRYREMVSDRSREMLRLVHESGELKTRAEKAEARVQELEREKLALIAERDHAGMLQRRAEAELATVRKRIAEAQVEQVRDDESTGFMLGYGPHVLACFDKADVGKRYALLPLDDEAKS